MGYQGVREGKGILGETTRLDNLSRNESRGGALLFFVFFGVCVCGRERQTLLFYSLVCNLL